MTGREFITKLESKIMMDGKWDKVYTFDDLIDHTAPSPFWDSAVLGQREMQKQDLVAAQKEVDKLHGKPEVPHESSH